MSKNSQQGYCSIMKYVVSLITAFLIFVVVGLIGLRMYQKVQSVHELREASAVESEYNIQNNALHLRSKYSYSSYADAYVMYLCCSLHAYAQECEDTERLTAQDIEDYLSNEFNEDGSYRFSNRPDKIEKYINYYCYHNGEEKYRKYRLTLSKQVDDIEQQFDIDIPEQWDDPAWTMEQAEELCRFHDDPTYQIDVTLFR